jgi:hypothetical protein
LSISLADESPNADLGDQTGATVLETGESENKTPRMDFTTHVLNLIRGVYTKKDDLLLSGSDVVGIELAPDAERRNPSMDAFFIFDSHWSKLDVVLLQKFASRSGILIQSQFRR